MREAPDGRLEMRVSLARGFRHQIRAHLAWMGLPLAGDSLYGRRPLAEALPARFPSCPAAAPRRRSGHRVLKEPSQSDIAFCPRDFDRLNGTWSSVQFSMCSWPNSSTEERRDLLERITRSSRISEEPLYPASSMPRVKTRRLRKPRFRAPYLRSPRPFPPERPARQEPRRAPPRGRSQEDRRRLGQGLSRPDGLAARSPPLALRRRIEKAPRFGPVFLRHPRIAA